MGPTIGHKLSICRRLRWEPRFTQAFEQVLEIVGIHELKQLEPVIPPPLSVAPLQSRQLRPHQILELCRGSMGFVVASELRVGCRQAAEFPREVARKPRQRHGGSVVPTRQII